MVTKVVYEAPPSLLLLDCEEPKLRGDTFGDVLMLAMELQAALRGCNTDKYALRQWRDSLPKE